MRLHQAPIGQFVKRIMADPAGGRLDGIADLPTLTLHLRQAIADGIHPAVPVFALVADPRFKVRSIIEIEPFQKISTIDVERLSKPDENVVLSILLLYPLPSRGAWRGASQCPASLQGVQFGVTVGGEAVAC